MDKKGFYIYHSLLRIALLVFTFLLLMVSGFVTPITKEYALLTQQQLASAIGVTVGVAPNELNVITSRLSEMEQQLLARESALREREIAVGIGGGAAAGTDRSTFVIAGILFILLLLIILNYVLDWLRNPTHTVSARNSSEEFANSV